MTSKFNSSPELMAAPTLGWIARRSTLDDGGCLRRKFVAGDFGWILIVVVSCQGCAKWCLATPWTTDWWLEE